MKLQLLVFSWLLVSFQMAHSQQLPLYYGNEFLSGYQSNQLLNTELKEKLFQILSGGHIKNPNTGDTVVPSCASAAADSKCVEHHALGYDGGRKKLFGQLYLQTLTTGEYAVTDVYCERTYTDKDFNSVTFGPDMVPSSGNIINTEHTWPQSRFTGRFPRETQKSDLHHLFPSDSEMNSHRGSLHFGNVVGTVEALKCPIAKLGHQASGEIVFEPPTAHKGNVARAIFYFATRYQMKMSPAEEAALREWNKADPVDAAEFERNNQIENLQGNRNPFVDFSDLADHIDHF